MRTCCSVKVIKTIIICTEIFYSALSIEPVSVSTNESLFDWTTPNVKLSASYRCFANTILSRFSNIKNMQSDDAISVSVSFSNLQVQAFKFDNNGTKFDDGK